jgi:hypothetical protein
MNPDARMERWIFKKPGEPCMRNPVMSAGLALNIWNICPPNLSSSMNMARFKIIRQAVAGAKPLGTVVSLTGIISFLSLDQYCRGR